MDPAILTAPFSPLFVSAAAERNRDPRITIRQADACALPFEDDRFDAALALLVLHFVPEAHKAIAEMRRVVLGLVFCACACAPTAAAETDRLAFDVSAGTTGDAGKAGQSLRASVRPPPCAPHQREG